MGLSKKEVYNNALSKVCRKRITSVDDDSFESNLCNELYSKALDDAISEHSWSSLIKRIKLVETLGSPVMTYAKSFQLPNDFNRLINAYYSTDSDSFDFIWEIQGTELLTDETSVYIKYVSKPATTEVMSAPLTNVLVQKIAIALAFPMNADPAREDQLIAQYETNILPRAKSIDSMDSHFVEIEENPAIESLYSLNPRIR